MELLTSGWSYISEGNAHIVLQLTGTEHVLRLIKEDEKPTPILEVQNSTMFVNRVMAPLLNCKSNYQEIISLPEKVLTQLGRDLHEFRPENRRLKSKLSSFAIKTMNLAKLSQLCHTNYCIEVKPKEGFLAASLKLQSLCYYCLNQYLKLEQHKIQNKSEYCPLDLFSGVTIQMKMALMNLLKNPQNNLKIFKDGKIVFDENSEYNSIDDLIKSMNVFKNVNIFLDFLIEVLLSPDNQSSRLIETAEVPNKTGRYLEDNSQKIYHKHQSFLYKLLQIQKLSDTLNIDFTNIGYGKDYVPDILDHISKNSWDLRLEADRKAFIKTVNPLHLAMISAVAKDCSIMISFSPEYIEHYPYINVSNKKVPYRVSLTDLEPKNIESLIRRRKTEIKMIAGYKKYLNNDVSESI